MQDEKYILVDSEESLANLLADLELYEMAAVDTERIPCTIIPLAFA